MKIGVISDTHGFLHPRIESVFKDVDLILHAGDVGKHFIIQQLARLAHVEAVYGNTDMGMIRDLFEEELVLDLKGHKIALCHGAGKYDNIMERLSNRFEPKNVDIIVFGHTHTPTEVQKNGIFFFNPGYGRKTAGILELDESGGFTTSIVRL